MHLVLDFRYGYFDQVTALSDREFPSEKKKKKKKKKKNLCPQICMGASVHFTLCANLLFLCTSLFPLLILSINP